MKIYQVLASRPRYEDPWAWTVPELDLSSTTPRLDDIKRDARKLIAAGGTAKEFDVEMFVRFDPDAAREVHHGAIRMCKLLGFHPGERATEAPSHPPRALSVVRSRR